MDLKPVADELYGLSPKEFTAARNAAAKQADDKDLAKAIADLRKPTVGAWAVNRLVRDAPAGLEEALGLSTAQLTMRELGRRRKELLEALVYRTLELTGPLADDAVTQVRNTLTAAMSDPESAEQVRAGHLTKGLEMLKALPNTPERTQQELGLQLTLGIPLSATRGYAAPEVAHIYTRAQELCQHMGETP